MHFSKHIRRIRASESLQQPSVGSCSLVSSKDKFDQVPFISLGTQRQRSISTRRRHTMNARSLTHFLVLLALWLCIGCASTVVMAQIGGNGSIQGTVTDPGGAVVPGATVVVTNIATGVETSKQTNAAGVFMITPLPPGEYKVVVSLSGFQTLIQEKVVVDALTAVTVNVTLQVGKVT